MEQSSETDARILVGGRPYRDIDSRCWAAGRLLADMDAEGVALQVVSPVPVTFCHDAPARCFALGAAVARAMSKTGKRVALVASSSWSHAFLNDKDWHLRPDTAADHRLYDAFARGDYGAWTAVTGTARR